MLTPNEHFTDQIKCSLIIKELNVLEKHLCEKVWLADSLLTYPSLARLLILNSLLEDSPLKT